MINARPRTWLATALLVLLAAGCSKSAPDRSADGAATDASPTAGAPAPVEESADAGRIDAAELSSRLAAGEAPLLLDVRSREEFAAGHIPGALNIPYDELPARLGEIEHAKSAEIIVYCRTGRRAKIAEDAMREAGFVGVRDLDGHMTEWAAAGLPVTEAVSCC